MFGKIKEDVMRTNPNDSATAFAYNEYSSEHGGDIEKQEWGLTKREWFAGLAMQGILAAPECVLSEAKDIASIHGVDREVILAHLAALQADALIAELNKGDDDE